MGSGETSKAVWGPRGGAHRKIVPRDTLVSQTGQKTSNKHFQHDILLAPTLRPILGPQKRVYISHSHFLGENCIKDPRKLWGGLCGRKRGAPTQTDHFAHKNVVYVTCAKLWAFFSH